MKLETGKLGTLTTDGLELDAELVEFLAPLECPFQAEVHADCNGVEPDQDELEAIFGGGQK